MIGKQSMLDYSYHIKSLRKDAHSCEEENVAYATAFGAEFRKAKLFVYIKILGGNTNE